MELSTSDMRDKQRAFRAEYRRRIIGWYNGWLHVAVIGVIGIASMYVFITNIENPVWWEWLTIPVVFVLCNVFEWFLHLHVMHRPTRIPGMRAIYQRHTINHHQFFTEQEMRFADHWDWRVTFFPPFALVVFILMSIPPALLLGWLISPNVGWLVMCSTSGMYLIYEFMHFCCHVSDNWFLRYCPFLNTIRRHHTAHHEQSIMMERNMNLTFPISDWLFGTSDLDRGLLGHLFNGYSTKYLRENMRRTSRTPTGQQKRAANGKSAAT